MEVVVTSGAIRRAKLHSNCRHQQTNTQLFTGQMPFLSPNQQCHSSEGNWKQSELVISCSSSAELYVTWYLMLHRQCVNEVWELCYSSVLCQHRRITGVHGLTDVGCELQRLQESCRVWICITRETGRCQYRPHLLGWLHAYPHRYVNWSQVW